MAGIVNISSIFEIPLNGVAREPSYSTLDEQFKIIDSVPSNEIIDLFKKYLRNKWNARFEVCTANLDKDSLANVTHIEKYLDRDSKKTIKELRDRVAEKNLERRMAGINFNAVNQ